MSYEAERQTLTQAFKTAWDAGSALPVQYENIDFDPPADGSPYLSFSILRGQAAVAGMVGGGVNRYRHPGLVQIDVVTAVGEGTRVGTLLVDEVCLIFRGQNVSGIIFSAPDVRRMIEPETSRHRFIVTIPFYRDENF